MPRHPVNGPGFTGIICSRGGRKPRACAFCGEPGGLLCDGRVKVGDVGHTKSCDKSICARCAYHPEPEKDFCPSCAPEESKRRRGEADIA